jgi:RNA polymerase subunit RPABC4/transcription elongation factor Spt4
MNYGVDCGSALEEIAVAPCLTCDQTIEVAANFCPYCGVAR